MFSGNERPDTRGRHEHCCWEKGELSSGGFTNNKKIRGDAERKKQKQKQKKKKGSGPQEDEDEGGGERGELSGR